eukprot:scaffold329_cov390-Pavlova_lutheri.AAC.14
MKQIRPLGRPACCCPSLQDKGQSWRHIGDLLGSSIGMNGVNGNIRYYVAFAPEGSGDGNQKDQCPSFQDW